jgi:RNA polymerase sigma-70 factor (ECF subfamily)
VVGPTRATRFLINIAKRSSPGAAVRYASINGQPGIILEEEGAPVTVVVLDVIEGVVSGVRVVSNPDKLPQLRRGWGQSRPRPGGGAPAPVWTRPSR